LPQGCSKKIQFNLLLADFALKFRNAPLRQGKFIGWSRRGHGSRGCGQSFVTSLHPQDLPLGWTSSTAQRDRAARAETLAPLVKVLALDPQFARQRTHVLSSFHPSKRR
jgi:hypothetical protein